MLKQFFIAENLVMAACLLVLELKEKEFYPGPGLEPRALAFRANALANWAIEDKYQSTIELISQNHPFWPKDR